MSIMKEANRSDPDRQPVSYEHFTSRKHAGNVFGRILDSMKKVEAIIKPGKLDQLQGCLRQAGAQGITVSEVRGFGRTGGRKDAYLGSAQVVDFNPKVRIQMMIEDHMVQPIVEAIQTNACTGETGDGKIFVSDVIDAIRIRTGARGHDAL